MINRFVFLIVIHRRGSVKISVKLISGFAFIVVILIVVLFVSSVSTAEINTQGEEVASQIEKSARELDLFKVYDKFDNDMGNLIKIVLSLGYVDDIEESENLKADFTSQIKKIYAQVDDNQEFVSSLNEIEDEVMHVFLVKEMEIGALSEMNSAQKNQKQLFETRGAIDEKISGYQTVDEQKVIDFIGEFVSVKDKFEGLRKPTDEQKQEVINEFDKTILGELTVYEIEELWKPENLGITVKEFASIEFLTRNILLNPDRMLTLFEEINSIANKIKTNIEFQVKFGSSIYDPVSSQLITSSLEQYVLKLSEIITLISESESKKQTANDLKKIIEESRDMYDESWEIVFDLLTGSVLVKSDKLGKTISNNLEEQYTRLEGSFDLIELSNEKSIETIERNNTQILLLILLSIILSVVIAIVVYLGIRFAIKRLVNKANVLKELDLTLDFNEASKNDEIGEIENIFSDIVATIRDTLFSFKSAVGDVKEATEELEMVSEVSQKISNELKKQAEETDGEVQNTSAAIEEVSSGIEEVAASARDVSNISSNLFEKTKETSESAKEGQVELNKVASVVGEAETHATETTNIVNELQKKARNVGEIVEVISAVSEQTNLLALNAAIEAARAGEAGKGFAVVADEIRKLAEESKKATQDIEKMLKDISNSVVEVDTASRKTVDIVKDMNSNSRSALEQFEKILDNLSVVSDSVRNLNDTSDIQSAAAGEIADVMDKSAQSMVKASDKVQDM
jgi:methyl-accepting chemotaxis protein